MSLFANAVGAIQIAIEDFDALDDRRVHAAIRNLHAGILLLCKVKLQRMSPPGSDEVLLKQNVEPHQTRSGDIVWHGIGKKTVDQQAIKHRLKTLGVVLDWKRLGAINEIRNNTEHYFFTGTKAQAVAAFADACVLIRQLLTDVLDEDPVAQIGATAWSRLYDNKQVYDQELKACQASLAALQWSGAADIAGSICCPNCSSQLVRQADPDNTEPSGASFHCTACNAEASNEDIVLYALEELFGAEAYIAAKDGGEPPVTDCPECGQTSFVFETGLCALCDFELPENATCDVCGAPLTPEDYSEQHGLCGYHSYVADRERDR